MGLVPQKLKPDKVELTLLEKDWLEAQSSEAPVLPIFPEDPLHEETPPPPLSFPVRKQHSPKGQNTCPSSLVTSLLAHFQQSQLG